MLGDGYVKKVSFLLVLLMFSWSGAVSVAAQNSQSDELVNFSVQAILPSNQVGTATYFDLEMEPGQVQNLEVSVSNTGTEPIQVELTTNTAATNSNGLVVYDGSIKTFSDTLAHSFSEIAQTKDSIVTVEAGKEKNVIITVNAPEESFDGRILGGLYFKLVNEAEDDQAGIGIQNEFAYVIAVNIVEKGNSTFVKPDFELVTVSPELINYREGLQTTFNSLSSSFLTNVTIEASIFSADDLEEAIYTRKTDGFAIAPHSQFNFPILFEEEALTKGDYVFKATMTHMDTQWAFEETFSFDTIE